MLSLDFSDWSDSIRSGKGVPKLTLLTRRPQDGCFRRELSDGARPSSFGNCQSHSTNMFDRRMRSVFSARQLNHGFGSPAD